MLAHNQRTIARLVPEYPEQNALEILGDLYRTLDDETADALVKAIDREGKSKRQSLTNLPDPRDS